MIKELIPCFELLDDEFSGNSWNGPSLMATLDKLSAAEAASVATWEGYSAWELGIHCAKTKRVLAEDLGVKLAPWPFSGKDEWFTPPEDVSEAAWKRDRALFRETHDSCMRAFRSMTPEILDSIMPAWKTPFGKAIAWLCTHDAFHGAQIRSMGLKSLREAKK